VFSSVTHKLCILSRYKKIIPCGVSTFFGRRTNIRMATNATIRITTIIEKMIVSVLFHFFNASLKMVFYR